MSKAPLALCLGLLCASVASAQDEKQEPKPADRFAKVEITHQDLGGGVYMLQGAGGNMALLTGEDGAILVDDQFAPLAPKIKAKVAELSKTPLRFVLNTHWHGDHTGGNETLANYGAVIVAHALVRKRLSKGQFITALKRKVPPAAKGALPIVTFKQEMNFHLGGETVNVRHIGPAHTDGDALIRFETANVIHTGDTFSNRVYPFIDVSSGGSLQGMIVAATRILALTDDATQIVPGHGPLASKKDLEAYLSMLTVVHERIGKLIAAGKTADEVVAAKPTAEYDATWGGGFLPPEKWVRIVHETMVPPPAGRKD